MIVLEEKLSRANAMMQTMWTLTAGLAPLVAATVLSLPSWISGLSTLHGVMMVFLLDAFTFFISGLTLLFLHIPSPKQKEQEETPKAFWSDVRLGFWYLRKRSNFLWLLSIAFVVNIVYASELLFPVIVKQHLVEDWTKMGWTYSYAYGFLETIGFAGATIAGVLMSSWNGKGLKHNQLYPVLIPLLINGCMFILFGFSTWLMLSSVFLFIRMFFSVVGSSFETAIWQRNVPPEVQGSVFGAKLMLYVLMQFFNKKLLAIGEWR